MSMRYQDYEIKTLQEIDVKEKSVFCRVDLNAPVKDGKVTDDTRIQAILPTLKYLIEQNAKVALASHLGRPKGKPNPDFSLLPVAEYLAELIGKDVTLPDDCIGDGPKKLLKEQRPGSIILLENLRFHAEEEKNDPEFAKALKGVFEVYVSDAFGAMHRAHASTDALPRLFDEKACGFLVEKELKYLEPLVRDPERPYAVILGGAKISDKLKVIEHLLRRVNKLFVGGAMVFTFLRAMGHKTGNSLVEKDMLERAKKIMDDAKSRGVRIYFPKDFRIGKSVENPGDAESVNGLDIPDEMMGLDIGPETVRYFNDELRSVKTVFWNGPVGLFEKPPFDEGTKGIAKALSGIDATIVIGGGDSASAVKKAGAADKMEHISTGGGATLEFLEGKALPGLVALAN